MSPMKPCITISAVLIFLCDRRSIMSFDGDDDENDDLALDKTDRITAVYRSTDLSHADRRGGQYELICSTVACEDNSFIC